MLCFVSMKTSISSCLHRKPGSCHEEYPGGIQKKTKMSLPHNQEPAHPAISLKCISDGF